MYNTPILLFKQCLSSILSQNIIDKIQTVIIDDNSSIDYSSIVNAFSVLMDIKYIKLNENHGAGYCRQYSIENSESKYIGFIDSDDELYNPYSMYMLYDKIEKSNCEYVSGGFIKEEISDSQYPLSISKVSMENQTWLWARLFRRDFLNANNIKVPDLRYNEDVIFMDLCATCSTNHEFIKNTVYVWKYNDASLTRDKNSAFNNGSKGLINFVESLSYSHILKREMGLLDKKISKSFATDGLCISYWYLIKIYCEHENEDCKRFLESMQKYYNLVTEDYPDIVNSQELKESYFAARNTVSEISDKYVPRWTIWDILSDLEETKNEVKYDSNCKYQFG